MTADCKIHKQGKPIPGSADRQGQMKTDNQVNPFGAGYTAALRSEKEA